MKQLTLFVLLLSIIACIPEDLPITDIPQAESKLVISAINSPNVGNVILITRSINALDEATRFDTEDLIASLAVSGARVKLIGENGVKYYSEIAPGFYELAETEFKHNATYKLEVSKLTTGEVVNANAVYKEPISLYNAQAKAKKATADSLAEITVTFYDIPTEKNWYMVTTQPYAEPQANGIFLTDEDVYTHIFTDEEIDPELEGEYSTKTFTALDLDGYDVGDSILLSFANISEEYYDYLEARENDLTNIEFLYEPYNYPSNIINGYGFFSMHAIELRILQVQP